MPSALNALSWQAITPPVGTRPDKLWPVDPYLLWAEATGYAGYPPPAGSGDQRLPVLMEFPFPLDLAPAAARVLLDEPVLKSALASSWTSAPDSCYHTAFLPRALLQVLVQMQHAGYLVRFQLGASRGDPVNNVTPKVHTAGSGAAAIHTIGIVDDGCCLAHQAFRGAGADSRFEFVWDQTPQASFPSPWVRYQFQGSAGSAPSYGGELSSEEINDLLARHPTLGQAGERLVYQALDRPAWGRPDRHHGACVLHLLAGPAKYLPPPGGASGAESLRLMFVQLPDQTVSDTSGGSIGFYVLDAVRYILRRTQEINGLDVDDWCCTINISVGSLGGPHDGSTIVERALDEAIRAYKAPRGQGQRVRIVMAAGNAAQRRVHGVRQVDPNASADFDVMVPPDNALESFIELWPMLGDRADADALQVHVRAPGGEELRSAKVGTVQVLKNSQGQVVATLVFARAAAQGEYGPMVLLGVRPTRRSDQGEGAPYGTWTITVASSLATGITVHGWVERNDTVIRRRSRQRTVFLDSVPTGTPGGWLSDESTLSSLAHGQKTDCVGAYEIHRRRVTDYSSRGPALRDTLPRPSLHGASDVSASLAGVAVPGFFSGQRTRLSGTSAAAPRVARWIAEGADPARLVTIDPGGSTTSTPGSSPSGVAHVPELDGI